MPVCLDGWRQTWENQPTKPENGPGEIAIPRRSDVAEVETKGWRPQVEILSLQPGRYLGLIAQRLDWVSEPSQQAGSGRCVWRGWPIFGLAISDRVNPPPTSPTSPTRLGRITNITSPTTPQMVSLVSNSAEALSCLTVFV